MQTFVIEIRLSTNEWGIQLEFSLNTTPHIHIYNTHTKQTLILSFLPNPSPPLLPLPHLRPPACNLRRLKVRWRRAPSHSSSFSFALSLLTPEDPFFLPICLPRFSPSLRRLASLFPESRGGGRQG